MPRPALPETSGLDILPPPWAQRDLSLCPRAQLAVRWSGCSSGRRRNQRHACAGACHSWGVHTLQRPVHWGSALSPLLLGAQRGLVQGSPPTCHISSSLTWLCRSLEHPLFTLAYLCTHAPVLGVPSPALSRQKFLRLRVTQHASVRPFPLQIPGTYYVPHSPKAARAPALPQLPPSWT